MVPVETPDRVRLSFPSRFSNLTVLEAAARALCGRVGFDEMATSQVVLAVVEAGTNGIQHGHQRDAGKLLDVAFDVWPDRLEIVIHDTGPGFDPSAIDTEITNAEERFLAKRGRGMYIMHSCMDSVDFRFDAEGTFCHLVKRRNAGPAGKG